VFRIWIYWSRIQIQIFLKSGSDPGCCWILIQSRTDPDQTFLWQRKFWLKIVLNLTKDIQAPGEAYSPQKTPQTWNPDSYFVFGFSGPYLDSRFGSGSADRFESGSNPNPDPKHIFPAENIYFLILQLIHFSQLVVVRGSFLFVPVPVNDVLSFKSFVNLGILRLLYQPFFVSNLQFYSTTDWKTWTNVPIELPTCLLEFFLCCYEFPIVQIVPQVLHEVFSDLLKLSESVKRWLKIKFFQCKDRFRVYHWTSSKFYLIFNTLLLRLCRKCCMRCWLCPPPFTRRSGSWPPG
jgi:hypothetical protein